MVLLHAGNPPKQKGLWPDQPGLRRLIRIYIICHELTVETENFIKRVLKNVIKRAFGELNNVFQDEFNKFYRNSQRTSDSFYHITESGELDEK